MLRVPAPDPRDAGRARRRLRDAVAPLPGRRRRSDRALQGRCTRRTP